MPAPTLASSLQVLTKDRLVAVAREVGLGLPARVSKDEQLEVLLGSDLLSLPALLANLSRDELRAACRAHELPEEGRSRQALALRLLSAAGLGAGDELAEPAPAPYFGGNGGRRYHPQPGDVVVVRHRQYLVEDVEPPPEPRQHTLCRLVCLDDDAQGREEEVLWELELGAQVVQPETHGLGTIGDLDPPRHFAAYLHSLRWNSVTATDPDLFQAPFRAGIQLLNHQMTPLRKALRLPRVNLFIADDVGLGKTIEAGLVLQELLLRQKVELVVVSCPASVTLQWRDEMQKRFGLAFEIYDRRFVARRRQERGFQVNPWSTHDRFVISHSRLRDPEYREPLLQHLGERAPKSLLILDEAHVAAPSSGARYAIDSRITRVIRDVAPRFENRLFLSATPHNGHSNSFSALLALLDQQRFTRGVPIRSAAELEPVMVRRLKADLRRLGVEGYPERQVVQIELGQSDGRCLARYRTIVDSREIERDEPRDVGGCDFAELELSRLLHRYGQLVKPVSAQGKLAVIHLQNRLLSSIEAFHRTLHRHAKTIEEGRLGEQVSLVLGTTDEDDDEYGVDEETREATLDAEVEVATRALATPEARARDLLATMLDLSSRYRLAPDGKFLALLDWIRRKQCAAVEIGGAARGADGSWRDRRVIVFTEWAHTKAYLERLLRAAIEGTDRAGERILSFHGGMDDEARSEVQRAFNSPPGEHPVRILLATDAAREGINLQGHCADLFHFDLPWNPSRLEQRNGRIDRTLQPQPTVRCHYFVYPDRIEDVVLQKVIEKVDRIQRELGSLGTVVLEGVAKSLQDGIDETTAERLDAVAAPADRAARAEEELESQRRDLDVVRRQLDEAGRLLNASRKLVSFDPKELRNAVDVGLEMVNAGPLRPGPSAAEGEPKAWLLPDLDPSWQPTLDALRPPRSRDEPFWEWRRRPPLPVVFTPPKTMSGTVAHLHLEHPFVRRILQRFRAQGFSAHDLSRVTVVPNPRDSLARVVVFGRLSLFGPGATRLHDQLLSVAAPWLEAGGERHLRPFAEEADRKAIEQVEDLLAAAPREVPVGDTVRRRLLASAPGDFAALWPHLQDEADAAAHEAGRRLADRAVEEAEAMRRILERQRRAIEKELAGRGQLALVFEDRPAIEREQFQQEGKSMERRLGGLDRELAEEPDRIAALYQVVLHRLEPVGLVYLWPESRG